MKVKNILKFLASIVIPLILLSPILNAQVSSIHQGDVVRLTAPKYSIRSVVGTLVDLKHDTLNFRMGERTVAVPLQQITKLEVARGKKRQTGKGALVGGTVGGLGLGVTAAVSASGQSNELFTYSPGGFFVAGFLVGGLVGSVTGAIIGSGSTSIRWEEVPLKDLSPASPAPVDSLQMRSSEAVSSEQETANKSERKNRRWRFSASLGSSTGGPVKDIEKVMIRDGFDDTLPGWGGMFGPVYYPISTDSGINWSMQFNYALNQWLDAAALYSQVSLGETRGHHIDPLSLSSSWLSLNYSTAVISPLIILKAGKIVQLGAGPGIFLTKIEQDKIRVTKKTSLGVVFQAAVAVPRDTRFFVRIDARYSLIPTATYGPFDVNAAMSLQPFQANFSHGCISSGFGIRL